MNFATLATLAAALAQADLDRGAVDPPTWNAVILAVAIASAIFHIIRKTPDRRHLDDDPHEPNHRLQARRVGARCRR